MEYDEHAPVFSIVATDGKVDVLYRPQPYQLDYHASAIPNFLMIGPRGTGKSTTIRMDSHMRAMAIPGFRYLTLRRSMKELRSSHTSWLESEMARLGGKWNKTEFTAYYKNGSIGYFSHCEAESDVTKHLGGQFDLVNFDEATTFPKELFLKISATARVPEGSGRIALVRGGTNPLGVGADFIHKYFIKHLPDEGDDGWEEYDSSDWGVLDTKFTDNRYIDEKQYRKRFAHFPAHVRKAWLDGEWVSEDAYFADFRASQNGQPWHVTRQVPQIGGRNLFDYSWIRIYRALDWGYSPDPAVCLWIAVLPNGRAFVFKEKHWNATLAADVARSILQESEGMNISETFCDPTLFTAGKGNDFTIGQIIEMNGVPLTQSINDRMVAGYAIHEYLNTLLPDMLPKVQFLEATGRIGVGCPFLIRTIQEMRTDKKDPSKIADGNDHWVIAFAYFCMGKAPDSVDPQRPTQYPWMRRRHQSVAVRRFTRR